MNVRLGLVLPLICFVALLALFVFGLGQDPDRALPSPLVGKPLPAFELTRLDGKGPAVRSGDIKHPRWVFNVWASWCAPCREELPVLAELARKSGVPVVGLNYKDKPADAAAMLRQFGNPYAYSVTDESGRYGVELGVYGVPETFVIDGDGVILFKHVGPVNADIVDRQIMPHLRVSGGS